MFERSGLVLLVLIVLAARAFAADPKAEGYRGIWYAIAQTGDLPYKYSGGLGTYCADHIPLAVYAAEVNKTFFVYGGTKGLGDPKPLLEMIGCYDHGTGMVSRPTIVMEKGTGDAHHNPVLSIDKDGYLWVFCAAHGGKDGFIYKSRAPYSIEAFDRIAQREFSYPQPWYVDGFGFVFLFTKYTRGRELYFSTSPDGINWSEDRKFAGFDGHYQVTWIHKNKIGSSFNWHPGGKLDARTNLYYMETCDFGATWTNAAGKKLDVPLSSPQNDALVRDYQKEGLLVYISDIAFDQDGRPVIFYNLSKGFQSSPEHGDRICMTAHWTGAQWDFRRVTTTDHNYDMGSIYIEDDGTWRIIAPTEPGPQGWCTGGEMVMWTSRDQGKTWTKVCDLTKDSRFNHTYARKPVNAHDDFYAFWADGDALNPSESHLYFASKAGDVRMLPFTMTRDSMMPHLRSTQ
jgi:hypothetical protein